VQAKSQPFVTRIEANKVEKLRHDLQNQGFEFTIPTLQHTYFQAKKPGVTCTLYSSLKLTVQGKEKESFIEFYLEPELLERLEYSHQKTTVVDTTARIGSDEAGKGDFFGPLCIAACFAEGKAVQKLIDMGVQDSKRLSDTQVLRLAEEIQRSYQHSIISIFPPKYNELYSSFQNLNKLLAWAHATAISNLVQLSGCKKVIIDQFAKEHEMQHAIHQKKIEIDLVQKVRAESDPVVAAASILARAAFLQGLQKLSKTIGEPLPKGAAKIVIDTGKKLVQMHGQGILQQISKLHFRSTEAVLKN
jgi:ribonuclease HIII